MGLFDMLKGKKKEDAESQEEEITTLGWDAIIEACKKIYPTQDNPKHYGTLLRWHLGGPDPLDGISIYDGGDYWHFVTFGLSELYRKETEDNTISGYGMEFTFKLKKDNYEDEKAEIEGICGILQSIARLTFNDGEIFRPYEYVYSGQTTGIDTKMKSNITGFITIPDKELESITTPYGKVDFVEFIGATDAELKAVMNGKLGVEELYGKIGSDVTSYNRQSVV